jgi:hypothetical protein
MKYYGALHIYIQTEMDFMDISSLGVLIDMLLKSSRNLSTRTNGSLDLKIHNNQSMINMSLTNNLSKTNPSHRKRRFTKR